MQPGGSPGQAPGLPQPGQTLGGKYEIVRLLGEGGMAFVYEASHQRLHQRVAIKLLTPEFARDPELVRRFEREARAVASLRTKHVARVIDVDATPSGVPYIVMEFLEGRDLDAELQARTSLPLDEAVDYILQACAGMLEAHASGIVHRDLKPANLFLAKDAETDDRIVKVLDFGISKIVGEATRLTVAGAVMGTVLYMSPEQVRAQPNVDMRADIWALGVILYELVAGRAPWEGHSHQIAAAIVSRDPPDIRSFVAIPEGAALVIHKMLQREPENRYATVRDLVAALAPFAPAGSMGAGVAEQMAGSSGGRRLVVPVPASMKYTMPMSSRPGAPLDVASREAREARGAMTPSSLASSSLTAPLSGGPSSTSTPSLSAHSIHAPLSARSRTRARIVLTLAVVIGLLGAAGVVLIVMTALRQTPPPQPTPPEPAALVPSGRPSGVASMTPAVTPTAVIESVPGAAPPSTGVLGRPSADAPAPRMTPAVPSGKRSPTPGRPAPTASGPPVLL